MATKKKTPRGTAAKKVQKRSGRKPGFLTDAECIVLRHKTARKEAAKVTRCKKQLNVTYGAYDVSSSQWNTPYRVEVRSVSKPHNSCACRDFSMNRLGTCKHIERVLQFLARSDNAAFNESMDALSPWYEIFFDTRQLPPVLRMLPARRKSAAVERVLDPFFGSDGLAGGSSSMAFIAIQEALTDASSVVRKKVRLSELATPFLKREAFLAELADLRKVFERDVSSGKRGDNPVNLPLYRYQKIGMKHLVFSGRALLADEMGLGKTVQAIAAAQLLQQLGKIQKVMVVCPTSLKAEWEEQLMHFTGREAKLVYGLRPQRLEIYAENHDFLVTNYEQIRIDVDEINRLYMPDLVILDEAQRIKNWPTLTSKTIKRLESPYAFVLTGTPMENRIEELYSLVEFIDPYVLGSLDQFQREFMKMDEDGRLEPANLKELHRRISSLMLRRRKSDVEDNLPRRTDKNFYVPMTDEQRTRYEEFAFDAAKILQQSSRRPLRPEERERLMVLLGCMRMTCDTPYILDPAVRDCPKLDELENIIDELLDDPDSKIIIFSEWVRMLDLVMELMSEKSIGFAEHTGRIPQQKRREEIKRFKQDPACRIFLSSESGGAGLNLQVADTVINLDLPWNPAKLEQRIARAWRKHQKRSVRVINIISEDSIESQMVDKLAYKTALANAVLDGVDEPKNKQSTQAFTERLSELMGVLPDEKSTRAKPVQAIDLRARFPDQVMGIETHPTSGRSIIVVRNKEAADRILQQVDTTELDVVDAATWHLIQRLAGQGLLTLSSELENTFSADGYEAPRAPSPIQKMHLRKARDHWSKHAGEAVAARTLADLNLVDQASPHLVSALRVGVVVLAILHAAHPRQQAEQVVAAKCGAHADLVRRLQAWLSAEIVDADRGLSLLDDFEQVVCNVAD